MKISQLTLLAVLPLSVLLAACGEQEPAPSKGTQEQSSRLDDIQKRSGGDWSKLSAADKSYLVNDLAHGSEASARMLLGPPPATPGAKKK